MTTAARVVRRVCITGLVTWPLVVPMVISARLDVLSLPGVSFAYLTMPIALVAWRGQTRIRRAASFVGASVLYGTWSNTVVWLRSWPVRYGGDGELPSWPTGDPIRDWTLIVGVVMLLSGLLGAALLSLIEWGWERFERRRRDARIGPDTPVP